MFKILFLLFIVVPLLELYVLIEVGSAIGALPTILLTIATAALGGLMMKYQGIQVVKQAQLSIAQGEHPQQQVLEGMLIFIGGVALLLPGLVTDVMGLLLLVPPARVFLAKRWLAKATQKAQGFNQYVHAEWTVRDSEAGRIEYHQVTRRHSSHSTGPTDNNDSKGHVIEGEVIDDNKK